MLLDHRTYTVRPGTLRKQLALYEKFGLAAQKRHFGEPLAWLVSETGDVNTYIHIWVYEDAADRSRKRAAMMSDPEWLAYIQIAYFVPNPSSACVRSVSKSQPALPLGGFQSGRALIGAFTGNAAAL